MDHAPNAATAADIRGLAPQVCEVLTRDELADEAR
jgi:hypothetical protein